jgi:hypothetical protein
MNENPPVSPAAPDSLPGMPAGNPPVATVAHGSNAGESPGLAGRPAPVSPKPSFGGNAGRKTRPDGLQPGSAAAGAADRAADAQRKRDARAAAKAVAPAPALPPVLPGAVAGVENPPETPLGAGLAQPLDSVLNWTAEDFRQTAPELIELCEAWRIECHTKRAAAGKLPKVVVEEIARGAAFPPGSKKSLSTSSPVTLAKMFNALKVPLAVKPILTAAPALAYIVVRDLQTTARIEKLIAENRRDLTAENAENAKT